MELHEAGQSYDKVVPDCQQASGYVRISNLLMGERKNIRARSSEVKNIHCIH